MKLFSKIKRYWKVVYFFLAILSINYGTSYSLECQTSNDCPNNWECIRDHFRTQNCDDECRAVQFIDFCLFLCQAFGDDEHLTTYSGECNPRIEIADVRYIPLRITVFQSFRNHQSANQEMVINRVLSADVHDLP